MHNIYKASHICTLDKASQMLHAVLFGVRWGWSVGGGISFPTLFFIKLLLSPCQTHNAGELLMPHTSLPPLCWWWQFSEHRSTLPGLARPPHSAPGAPRDGDDSKTGSISWTASIVSVDCTCHHLVFQPPCSHH